MQGAGLVADRLFKPVQLVIKFAVQVEGAGFHFLRVVCGRLIVAVNGFLHARTGFLRRILKRFGNRGFKGAGFAADFIGQCIDDVINFGKTAVRAVCSIRNFLAELGTKAFHAPLHVGINAVNAAVHVVGKVSNLLPHIRGNGIHAGLHIGSKRGNPA